MQRIVYNWKENNNVLNSQEKQRNSLASDKEFKNQLLEA